MHITGNGLNNLNDFLGEDAMFLYNNPDFFKYEYRVLIRVDAVACTNEDNLGSYDAHCWPFFPMVFGATVRAAAIALPSNCMPLQKT